MINSALSAQFDTMQPMGLEALESVALQNRIDTKYMLTEAQAVAILRKCRERFQVLEIEGRRGSSYHTQYFDTAQLTMYHEHHNGARDRYKVRLRSYKDSGAAWLEIKRKTNLDRTIKHRLSLSTIDPTLGEGAESCFTAEEQSFIRECTPYDPLMLLPVVNNAFMRVTLAAIDPLAPERITIDLGLHLLWRNRERRLPGIVVAEVKRSRSSVASAFVNAAAALRISPAPFSKYCLTIAMLAPNVRANLFKETVRNLERMVMPEHKAQPGHNNVTPEGYEAPTRERNE